MMRTQFNKIYEYVPRKVIKFTNNNKHKAKTVTKLDDLPKYVPPNDELKIIGLKVPKLKEISTQTIVEKEITQPKTGKGLLQEPINKYFQSTSTQSKDKDGIECVKDAINEFDKQNDKERETAA